MASWHDTGDHVLVGLLEYTIQLQAVVELYFWLMFLILLTSLSHHTVQNIECLMVVIYVISDDTRVSFIVNHSYSYPFHKHYQHLMAPLENDPQLHIYFDVQKSTIGYI